MNIYTIDLSFQSHKDTIACFLLEINNELALIESGPDSTFEQLTTAIADLGFDYRNIKKVFLTHIHFDHAGGAWRFADQGATIYVHPLGAKHMENPEKLYNSAKRIYQDDMERLWGAMNPIANDQIVSVENGDSFEIGDKKIVGWHTPGHAIHHIAWQIDQKLWTGDVAGVKIKNGPVVPPCPPPDINIEQWFESIDIINNLPVNELYLTHFGIIKNKEAHLEKLKLILEDWKNWMYPYFEANTAAEEIIPEFIKYCNANLIKNGLNAEEIACYESANPAFMSVGGLLRYWKIKTTVS